MSEKMSESMSENPSGHENEETNKSEIATPKNIFYESRCKTYQTVRRIIFKDSNGIFKETLDVVNGEKQTIFGSPPDLDKYEDWMIEELTEPHNIRKDNESRSTTTSQSRVSSNSSDTGTNRVDNAHISSIRSNISKEIQSIEYADQVAPSKLESSRLDSSSTKASEENSGSRDLDSAIKEDRSDGCKSNLHEKLDSSLGEVADSKHTVATFEENRSVESASNLAEKVDSSSKNTLDVAHSKDSDSAIQEDRLDENKSNLDEKLSSSANTSDEFTGSRDAYSKTHPDKSVRVAFSRQSELKFDSPSTGTSDKIVDSDSTMKKDHSNRDLFSRHNRMPSRDSSGTNISDEIAAHIRDTFSRQDESSITTNTSDEFPEHFFDLPNTNEDSDFQRDLSSKYHPSNVPNRRMWKNERNNNRLSKTWSPWTTDSKIELEREDVEGSTTMISDLQNRMYRNQPKLQSEVGNRRIYQSHDSVQSTQQQNFSCTKCQHLKSRLSAARLSNTRLSSAGLSDARLSKNRAVYDDYQGPRSKINYAWKAADYSRPTNDSIENLIAFLKQNYRPSNDKNLGNRAKFVKQNQSLSQRSSHDRPRSKISLDNLMEFIEQNQRYKSDRNAKRMSKSMAEKQFININKWADRMPSLDSSDYVYDVSSTSVVSYTSRRHTRKPKTFMNAQ